MAGTRTRQKGRTSKDWQRPRFEGQTFCLAGTLQWSDRKQATQLIAAEGGRVLKSVRADLDYLIVGQTPGGRTSSAEQKAVKLNQSGKAAIQVLDESGFHQLFVPHSEIAIGMLKAGPAGIARWNSTLGQYWLMNAGIDLRGSDFRKCDLADADLRHADVSGCDFSGAKFNGAVFSEVRGAKFEKVTGAIQMHHAVECSFRNADFGQVANPHQCTINASESSFDGVRFGNIHVHKLIDCTARRADLSAALLRPADFSRTDLTGARLSRVQASYSKAAGATLDKADLHEGTFDGAQFNDASFRKANMSRARLDSCSFSGADLSGAKLLEADMSSCNLQNANLSKANLRGALLCNADFTGAVLDGADLTGANISGAKLTPEQISSAKGVKPEDAHAGSIGPNIRELEKVAGQSKRVSVSIRVDLEDEKYVQLSIDSWGQSWAMSRQTVCGEGFDTKHGRARTVPDGLLEMANRWNQGTPRIDSVEVSASKAPLKKKELQLLAVAAWCEAFGLDVVTEDELKERRKEAAGDAEKLRDQAVADLRTSGVKKWNKLTVSQRDSLGRLRRLDLSGLDLQSGKFDDLDFQGTDFSGSDLRKARFDNSDLKKATFAGVNGTSAWFSGIKAADASFQHADLRKSTIRNATLLRADFSGSKLSGVDFSYSDVRGANFAGADLKGNTFQRVKFDEKTTFPDGFELLEELIWAGQGKDPRLVEKIAQVKSTGPIDFETFMRQLENNFDASRLKKAMKMLKAERFQLFAQVENDSVTGVVKSQTDADLVYSCRLDAEGTFACCTQNLNPCGGLRGALCKHLLVLIVGLTRGEELDPTTINGWIAASKLQAPKLDKDLMSEVFLKYKGAEAGEIDWRPTETVPEDYYAF